MSLYLKKDYNLAELVGIILGDGHLTLDYENSRYLCEISLNYVDERDYVIYVKNLTESIFNIEPTLSRSKSDKGIVIRVNRKVIVEALISIGLIPGDKVKNQVSVPEWIKKEYKWICSNLTEWELRYKPLVIACIKGLIDTDGTIYVNWNEKKNYLSIGIGFTSGSYPLVRDFKEMCETVGINMAEISKYEGVTKYGTEYTAYSTGTEAKDQVYKFIYEVIKPFKWKIKKNSIIEILEEHGTSLEEVFEYKRPYRPYEKERALFLKDLFEKLGSFNNVREYLIEQGEKPMKRETISNLLQTLFTEQGKSFELWKTLNSGIFLDKNVVGGIRLPLEVKKVICQTIYQIILQENSYIDEYEIIERLKNIIDNSDLKRLAYLLNKEISKEVVLDFLLVSVYFVKYLIRNAKDWNSPTEIRNRIMKKYGLNLPFHDSQIKEIIDFLFR